MIIQTSPVSANQKSSNHLVLKGSQECPSIGWTIHAYLFSPIYLSFESRRPVTIQSKCLYYKKSTSRHDYRQEFVFHSLDWVTQMWKRRPHHQASVQLERCPIHSSSLAPPSDVKGLEDCSASFLSLPPAPRILLLAEVRSWRIASKGAQSRDEAILLSWSQI